MHVTFGEVGSCVSMAVLLFRRTNIGLERDLPLLLLPTLLLRNRINGGGYFSARPGLDMGLVESFMSAENRKSLPLRILSSMK